MRLIPRRSLSGQCGVNGFAVGYTVLYSADGEQ